MLRNIDYDLDKEGVNNRMLSVLPNGNINIDAGFQIEITKKDVIQFVKHFDLTLDDIKP